MNDKVQNQPLALATVVQVQAPTSAQPGDKALIGVEGIVDGWVGGGCVLPAVVAAAKDVLARGQSCLCRVAPDGAWAPVKDVADFSSHCLGAGSVLLFVESLYAQPSLHILGQSEVARILATLAVQMDFAVTLSGYEGPHEQFPAQLNLDRSFTAQGADYIVIATQGQRDRVAIETALASECASIDMIISERKLQGLKRELRRCSHTDEQLKRLHGPAGININAKTPGEIALSVLASLVHKRRSVASTTKIEGYHTESWRAGGAGGGCCGSN